MSTEQEKLNIGIFVDAFFPMIDGVVNVVDNYAKRLAKIANVTVFTTSSRDKKYVDNFPYKVVRCQKLELPGLDYDLGLPTLDGKFMKELNGSNLDIVHIHSPFSVGKVGVNYAKKHKIPCVATNHSQYKQDFFRATNSPVITDMLLDGIMRVFNKCDENWSVNSEVANVFLEYGAKELPRVVNNATDMMFWDDEQAKENFKLEQGVEKDEKVFLFVGRICELKNIYFILDALKILSDKKFKYKMFYVGDGQDFKELKSRVEKYGLTNQIKLLGKITDKDLLRKYYAIADLFLFPSLYDCSSIVQIEAASQKLPVLFLQGAVTADGIVDKQNGYLSQNDVAAYANKIVEILADEKLYQQVRETCYQKNYKSWDISVTEAYNRYLYLIEKKKLEIKLKQNAKLYQKTIRSVKNRNLKHKRIQRKHQEKIKRNLKRYPKTIKRISKSLKELDETKKAN